MDVYVHIIDDDAAMLRLLKELLESVRIEVKTYQSAQDFISSIEQVEQGCILSDIRMPRMSGVELQQEIHKMGINIPIIFLTGYADVQTAVEAMQNEAFDFIEKPFNNQNLINRVQQALKYSETLFEEQKIKRKNLHKFNNLTSREKEVFKRIVKGEVNKVIAHKLDISVKTVEVHRSRVITKFQASGLVDLIEINNILQGH